MKKAIPPLPHFIETIKNSTTYELADALSEAIDNSFAPGKGEASIVYLEYGRKKGKKVWRWADNGNGVDNVERLFQFGNTTSWDNNEDIGGYGQGVTAAAAWLGDVMTVKSYQKGRGMVERGVHRWSSRQWECDVRDVRAHMLKTPVFSSDHGLEIVVSDCREHRVFLDTLLESLGFTYQASLQRGKKIFLNVRDQVHEVTPICIPEVQLPTEVSGSIDGKGYRGILGIAEQCPKKYNAVFVSFGFRVIDKFRGEITKGNIHRGFTGFVQLNDDWKQCLNPQKTKIAIDRDKLAEDIRPVASKLVGEQQEKEQQIKLENLLVRTQQQLEERNMIKVPGKHVKGLAEGRHRNGDQPSVTGTKMGIQDKDSNRQVLVPSSDGKEKRKTSSSVQLVKSDYNRMGQMLAVAAFDEGENALSVHLNVENPQIKAIADDPENSFALWLLVVSAVAAWAVEESRLGWVLSLPADYVDHAKKEQLALVQCALLETYAQDS